MIVLLCAACLVACGSRRGKTQAQSAAQADAPPEVYGYNIVNTYPHDAGAYTQGLFWHEGEMWESTGEYGRSTLRATALSTGEVTRRTSLSDDYFAEGAEFLNGVIYQLTWLEGKCFVYDPATLRREREIDYKGQGWGLATDGERLYMSDGTPNIAVRNPSTFAVERTIVVRNEGRPVQHINEMEWIEGKLWANLYMTYEIVIIDPADGRVEGVIDFSGIISRLDLTPSTDVMNGIAYDAESKRIFVTGKNWNRLFEISISNNFKIP